MIVVADSSPFIVLITIGHVEVLHDLYWEILIPPEAELGSSGRPEPVCVFISSPPAWHSVRSPSSIEEIPEGVAKLPGGLNPFAVAGFSSMCPTGRSGSVLPAP